MKIKACRICHNKELIKIGSLGNIAISDFTDIPSEGTKYPLELVYCERCTLLQLAHNTPRDLLYKNYWYESHINPVVVNDLKEIAKLCKGNLIDIGGNDGTLLKYATQCTDRICVDPSDIIPDDFFKVKCYWEEFRFRGIPDSFDTITAIACLYDLPDPNKFMENIKRHLKSDGVFISQLQTLSPMIELNDVGNICHEHLEYYSYKSLMYLFEQNGLEIFKVENNSMNGGSYRIFARHFTKGSIEYPEKEYGVKELKAFMKRIEENKEKIREFTKKFIYGTKIIINGYGASTKMGTITQYYNLSTIFVVDANPKKIGKYTNTGSLIIDKIPEGTEYLWVFPYGFIDYFKKKEKGYKGKWITTIPEFKIWT